MKNRQSDDFEYRRILRQFHVAAILSLIIIAVGAVFYHTVEDLSWVDAIYLCVITLATVGYGDITPQTDIGKVFTTLYVLLGIGIIATFVNLMLKRAAAARHHKE